MSMLYDEIYCMNVSCNITANLRIYSEDHLKEAIQQDYDIKGFRIIDPEHNPDEVKEIEGSTDASGIDPHNEYLILYLTSGETATFRNSFVLMDLRFKRG